jgi:hypothetical protein
MAAPGGWRDRGGVCVEPGEGRSFVLEWPLVEKQVELVYRKRLPGNLCSAKFKNQSSCKQYKLR